MQVVIGISCREVLIKKEKLTKMNGELENSKTTSHNNENGNHNKIVHEKNLREYPKKLIPPGEWPYQIVEKRRNRSAKI